MINLSRSGMAAGLVGMFCGAALAQEVTISSRALAANIIVPQTRTFRAAPTATVEVTGVDVDVQIMEQVATTRMDINLRNPSNRRQEAELVVPVPDDAVVKGFLFEGGAREPTAELLPKEEARRVYEQIVAKVRDPALLEFVDLNLIRSSVFPVEANGTQTVRLIYEHLLTADGERVDYVLPRSESVNYRTPWQISVHIQSKQPISTVYSPTHRLTTTRGGASDVTAKLAKNATTEPGPFRLSYLVQQDGMSASLMAYPDAKIGGGYFLLLAGVPATPPSDFEAKPIKREVVMVIDRSGSMNGEKIEQVREAALQIIAGLEPGEAFNIMTYNETVDVFAERSVIKDGKTVAEARAYLKQMTARGGTNIHDALHEALRHKPHERMLPIVLFLTDGLPTVGQTSEVAIRELVLKANQHNKRVFTFGVGLDVNTPLLEKIAWETRATSTFVLPKEDVELKVAQVFKRLVGPILADAELKVRDGDGQPMPRRVQDVLPGRLPDLFEGDQLVVLGQYKGDEPIRFVLSGNYYGRQRDFRFTFNFDKATTRNGFVPRLWASRKIGVLVDAIRQLGAEQPDFVNPNGNADNEKKLKELVDEIVRLSTEFGILTEYTAFLAREGTDLSDFENVLSQAGAEFRQRALSVRSGIASVNQERNARFQKEQDFLNGTNEMFDAEMNRVSFTTVQQINDVVFYHRNGQWVDSRTVGGTSHDNITTTRPARVVEFGTKEYSDIVRQLAGQGRQASVALRGDVLMQMENEAVLIRNPEQ